MEKNTSNNIIKIAIIGPESTGKSTLSEHLAEHYQTLWVPEYAREYCSKLTGECTLEDEMNMFRGQLALEDEAVAGIQVSGLRAQPKLLICDTTIVTVKMWCEHVFGYCPPEVQKEFDERHYDLYLLMNIDLPWKEDPLRDFPHLRQYFMDWYIRLMKEKNANYRIISGNDTERFENAIKVIEEFFDDLKPKS